jgi:hypothetical protein
LFLGEGADIAFLAFGSGVASGDGAQEGAGVGEEVLG